MSGECCETNPVVSALHRQQRRLLAIVLIINAGTFLMMVGAAFLSGSSSLLAGALDNFGDAVTYALSFLFVGASSAVLARVAVFKGLMILSAAVAVAVQIGWRLTEPGTPIFETMGIAAVLNLAANLICLRLLTPYRDGDINMSSAWECSRNDAWEGVAVISAAAAVWLFESGWPDLLIASALLALFLRSAIRVLSNALRELQRATV